MGIIKFLSHTDLVHIYHVQCWTLSGQVVQCCKLLYENLILFACFQNLNFVLIRLYSAATLNREFLLVSNAGQQGTKCSERTESFQV